MAQAASSRLTVSAPTYLSSISHMSPSQTTEKRIQWLKTLTDHLHTHVIPVATDYSHHLSLQTVQDAVLVALTSPVSQTVISSTQHTNESTILPTRPNTLPLDSTILVVKCLKESEQSFQAVVQRPYTVQNSDDPGDHELPNRSVILIALLTTGSSITTGSKHNGLFIKDRTGEISCEVVPPVQCVNCIVVLKEWTLVASSTYGNYLEIKTLMYVDQSHTLTSQPSSLQLHSHLLTWHTITDILLHIENGSLKKRVDVIGRMCAISEPFKNGSDFMIIIRITDLADNSKYCHIITQSPDLTYLPHSVKCYAIYAFTQLKSVIMNKGKDDEKMVLTTTSHSSVRLIPTEEEATTHLATNTITTTNTITSTHCNDSSSSSQRRHSDSISSPLCKKRKREDGDSEKNVTTVTSGVDIDLTQRQTTDLISYKGVLTRCLLPEAGVYELDDQLILYLTHCNLSNQGRGLREGAEVEIINAHVLKMSTQIYKKMSGLICCPLSRIEILHFSRKNTNFKAFVPQNKLADLLGRYRGMDVAWLTLIFLSLLKKFKRKKEAYNVLVELCEMMEMMKIQHNPHSSFLREPHQCPFLDPVDLSHRPLVPTVQYVKEFCRDQVTSALFSWRGANVMGTSGTLAPTTSPAAPLLSVAVSATWSFGIVKSTEFPNAQVLIGTLCGNRGSGHLELCDETGSIPLIVCIPYQSTTSPWLCGTPDGSSRIALSDFTVIVEKTEDHEKTENSKFSFYIHTQNMKYLNRESSYRSSVSDGDDLSTVLYVYIKSKNCLKPHHSHTEASSVCGFDVHALVHSSLEVLQRVLSSTASGHHHSTDSLPVNIVLGFVSARYYSYIHNNCTYRLSLPTDKYTLSLEKLRKECFMRVSDTFHVEMVDIPNHTIVPAQQSTHIKPLIEVGELVSKFYLPKLQSVFDFSTKDQSKMSEDCLVTFRGLVIEHSYRVDCDMTRLTTWQSDACQKTSTGNQATRHIVALNIRGVDCPNTVMVYCKYKTHESLPLGLIPGTIATFHNFSIKSSTRSGNMYCVNCASSSITIESIATVTEMEFDSKVTSPQNTSYRPTREMIPLPISQLCHLTRLLLQGRLSREVVCVRATIMTVQHACIQYQCQTCQCIMVDGNCRPTCPAKKASLSTDARLLIQDGTGEAHLYVKDGVLPVSLGITAREWSDLLDLVYKLGQVIYTKSSKRERIGRTVSIREKAESLFVDILTRPSLVRTIKIFCQPFLSSSELKIQLGCKSHRVWIKSGTEYVTLSLPRLQLRLLAITATSEPLSLANKLLSLLDS